MGWSSTIALFFSLVALALLPSLSVMTVLARSASLGFFHGAITSLGIVLGDIFYILLAIYGLTFLADRLGPLAMGIQVVGAFYLIILGLLLWRSPAQVSESDQPKLAMNRSWLSSFFAGFLLTLGDQKAIFFYLSFFPAFVDLSVLSPLDAGVIVAIAIAAVGGVKLGYAWVADRARSRLSRLAQTINWAAGLVLIAAGIAVLRRALMAVQG